MSRLPFLEDEVLTLWRVQLHYANAKRLSSISIIRIVGYLNDDYSLFQFLIPVSPLGPSLIRL